jgi:hypothetical protein
MLRCRNIDQNLAKEERDEREEGEGGREKEKREERGQTHLKIIIKRFKKR